MPKHTRIKIEEWRDIPGWEGQYQASSIGRIRSLDRFVEYPTHRQRRKGKVLKSTTTGKNHLYVNLGRGGRNYVHRLVAMAFFGEVPEGLLIRHKNDIPTDNRVENLLIGDYSDNSHDAVRNGRHPMANRTHCPEGHRYSAENTYIIPGSGSRACRTCASEKGRESYVGSRPDGWSPRKLGDEITECPHGHAFVPENTRRVKRTGSKTCIACARARSYLHARPELKGKFQEVSDSYYEKIMGRAAA